MLTGSVLIAFAGYWFIRAINTSRLTNNLAYAETGARMLVYLFMFAFSIVFGLFFLVKELP